MTTQNKIFGFNGNYRFLSNFFPSEIEFEGSTYKTVEHAYQAAKTNNVLHRANIALCETAGKAKQMGRELVLRPDWEDVKLPIMKALLRKKFYDHTLKSALLMTGEAELTEANYWHDNYWGSCTCLGCGDTGANHLGKLLMELREELRV